jgi:hypothetical protein
MASFSVNRPQIAGHLRDDGREPKRADPQLSRSRQIRTRCHIADAFDGSALAR